MDNKGQVQTNKYNVNVLVDTINSSNIHYSNRNRRVEIVKVLSNDDIIQMWNDRNKVDELDVAKDWITKQKGYATSNCIDNTLGIYYCDIVEYKE